ncbi:hypothetical protein RD792_010030 [Penstemon davidsonii]|uniref:NAB domain-containing protein n=1 Tax=Penstemon davidsonii TaxID=160366 RepID=A0ABR0D2H6_9LAMI|nr:hypothetical protein RD792_010030 [Penstemon davidsonii]
MATLLNSESRRLYSWWWDSHNTPKNSKWLQENLTDMDAKVKSMIKLIEEDADSFARRAEMYYKKRPELMKLVEEFYRAYRALAERYNHATGELRLAHRTIAKAFPDQVPLELVEDSSSPSKSLARDTELPQTPEMKCHIRALFDSYELLDDAIKKSEGHREDADLGMRRKGLKQLQEMFEAKEVVTQCSNENQDLKEKILQETERAEKAESEVFGLKKVLSDMNAEKEDVLGKLSNIEGELSNAQNDSIRLSEKASRMESEVRTLKEVLTQLEAEKNDGLVKHKEYLEKISILEAIVSRLQEDTKGLDKRAIEAECETETLKNEISRLELEKEEVFHQYKQCLENISDLENIISVMEDEVRLLKKQAERAEIEISELKKALDDLNKEKEVSALRYECCLVTISKLEKEIFTAKEEVKRLNNETLIGTDKLKNAEEKCTLFEMSNETLRIEADNLSNKIAMKDRELSEKQEELEKLENSLKNEHFRHAQVEATLQTLQNLHSQSQDDRKALALELKDVLQMLKELEVSKLALEEDIRQARDENETLSQTNFSSSVSMENMQNEILSLREIKERLEKEVSRHTDISNSLQKEISCLEEDIKGLNISYRALVEQVEEAGLDPKCVLTSMRSFHDGNSKVREKLEQEKMVLLKKLEDMEELTQQKVIVESSLSNVNHELEISREKVKALQEFCEILDGEKATLASEKVSLVSQVQGITENMHMILEKNAVLENSLSTAKVELEGLRERSKGLEEICELLKNEKSCILTERGNLALKLESVERRLKSLEKRFTDLEEKYADLEKEKASMQCKVVDLEISFGVEKQERTNSELQNKTRLAGLENEIHHLQEENILKENKFEEELENALKAQFEISILQKFMKDMEEKNYSLIIECQKHVEASRLAEKLISELESESLEQQVEAELLLDEIERLRLGIYQIFMALETGPDRAHEFENEQSFVHYILKIIEDMKCSVLKHEGDKQLLLVENSVLLTLLEQLESKGKEIDSQKIYLEKEFQILAEKMTMVSNEKDELLEMNKQLKSDINKGHQHAAILETELRSLSLKQTDLDKAYCALKEAYTQVNQDNNCLLQKFSDLLEEKYEVDQQHDAVLFELLETSNQAEVFKSFGMEKITEVELLLEDLNRQYEVNSTLKKDTSLLSENLELQNAKNLLLKDSVHRLENEMLEIKECNVKINQDMIIGKESLVQTEAKLLHMELKLKESLQDKENQENKILQLSEENSIQKKEIENLNIVNTKLKSELGLLREEMVEKIIREQTLSSELEDKNDEFELWEAEAASFCFDLQISSVNEVLFENKVKELSGVCETLEKERALKNSEIEQMKGRFCIMEIENNKLKNQISAYAPVIASLRDDVTFLEHNALLQTKLPEFLEVEDCPSNSEILLEDESLLSLQNLQFRIKEVAKLMEETNRPVLLQRKSNSNGKEEPLEHEQSDSPKLQKTKNKASEGRNGMLMKDIPLDQVSDNSLNGTRKRGEISRDDQMLELWETSEDGNKDQTNGESVFRTSKRDIAYDPPSTDSDVEKELRVVSKRSTEPNREVNDVKILERLASDAKKLESLQATVQNLRMKLEMVNKKNRKAAKNVDFETVNEQVLEAEETVENLVNLNCQMLKDIKECEDETKRKNVGEQARKGSERIGRVQLELQKIEYVLLKLEDEKKNKGKNNFFVLREFIYSGKGNNGKRKKGCGCFRPSTSRSENS